MLLLVEATLAQKPPAKQAQHTLQPAVPRPGCPSWSCVGGIGREAVLREASEAKPSGINTLLTDSLSEDESHLLVFLWSFIVCCSAL